MSNKYFNIIEIGAVSLIVIGIITYRYAFTFGEYLVMVALFTIVVSYSTQIVLPLTFGDEKPSATTLILTKMMYFLLTLALMGLNFKLFFGDVRGSMLKTSLIGFVFFLVLFLLDYRLSQNQKVILHYRRLLNRALIVMSLAFIFFLTPLEKINKVLKKNNTEQSNP